MKKLVSLLLACLMVLSIGMIPAFATTETELYAGKEAALEAGVDLPATPASTGGFGSTNFTPSDAILAEVEDGVGVAVKKDATDDIYFELDGYNSRTDNYHSHKLFIDDYDSTGKGTNSTRIKKYSAMVSLPSVTQGTTNVFGQASWNTGAATTGFNVRATKGFGVQLKNGGAYYYDKATEAYVNFVADGTMQADKYYRVEAIKDFRGRTSTSASGPYYMRAFVYDGDTLLGETGWVYPADESYKYDLDGRSTSIDAYGYPEKSVVKINEFKAYKLDNLPSYTVASGSASAITNKYVAASTSNLWRRTVGERFNLATTTANNRLGDGSANTAARYNISFRIPEFGSEFYLIDFIGTRNMLNNNTQALEGVAMVSETGEFGAKSVDGTAVALTQGTGYQLTANTWYNLEALVDYSTFAEPKATLILKDEAGNILTQSTQPYTISQIPNETTAPTYCQASLIWVAFSKTNKVIHFDNTAAYIAPSYADIVANTNITTVIEEDFETYLGEEAEYYDVGDKYAELVGLKPIEPDPDADSEEEAKPVLVGATHVFHSDGTVKNIDNAVIAADTTSEGIDFVDGMTLPATKAITLNLTYNNDIPNVNINNKSIKVYANNTELTPDIDYVIAISNDGSIADTTKTIAVSFKAVAPNTTYAIRLSAALSDYNATVTTDNTIMGVPADNGLYKDITFTTPDDVTETKIVQSIVSETGATVKSLAKVSAICGKVDVINTENYNISGYVALAVYDNGKLVDVKISDEFNVAPQTVGGNTTDSIALDKAGLKAKVFVWTGFDIIRPMILDYSLAE